MCATLGVAVREVKTPMRLDSQHKHWTDGPPLAWIGAPMGAARPEGGTPGRAIHAGCRVAGWAAAFLCLAVGCVAPPPMVPEPDRDHAPLINHSQVSPRPGTSHTLYLPTLPAMEFTVEGAASDPDDDALHTYWYLLYEADERGVAPVKSLSTFTYLPCQTQTHPPPLGEEPALMYLQVDVSDRPRLQTGAAAETNDPRRYPGDANVVTLSWLLVLRGTCPAFAGDQPHTRTSVACGPMGIQPEWGRP